MEWEEALLTAWGGDMTQEPAAFYRRRAIRTRQVAEGATTKAVRARLLAEADHYEALAAKADRAEKIAGLPSQ